MESQITLGDIPVAVVRKDIKNVHLSVRPPNGQVRISAPRRMSLETIRAFAISKLDWIRRHQARLRAQERETPREYVERESHWVWGERCLLTVVEVDRPPSVELEHGRLILKVRPGADHGRKRAVVDDWYRQQIRAEVPELLARWQPRLGVEVERVFVRRMKTRWGTCNTRARTIRLNAELAKKPPECLEYVVVHELMHLLEPSHNQRFVALMDRFMPRWRFHREVLNRLPVRREGWSD
jgi:predicted metal-dependent hydrolase